MFLQKIIQKIIYPNSHTNYFDVSDSKNEFSSSKEKRYKTIQNITKILVSTLDFDDVAQRIVDLMVDQMEYLGGIFFLPDEKNKVLIPWTTSNARIVKAVLKTLDKDLREFSQKYDIETENLVAKAFIEKKPFYSTDYSKFVLPALSKMQSNFIQKFAGINLTMAYPVLNNDKVLGVVLFSSAKNDTTEEERDMLQTFTELIGISIRNSSLYTTIKENSQNLANKNNDLQSLFNLTSQISKSLDPSKVSQDAVNSLPQGKMMIGGILTTYVEDKKQIIVKAVTDDMLSYQVRKIIGDFDKYPIDIDDPKYINSPTVKAYKLDTIQYTTDLEELFTPPIPRRFMGIIKTILNSKSAVIFPVHSQGKVVGTLTYLLIDKSYADMDDNEKQLLQTYTNQIAIALDNAKLYEESENTQRKLQAAISDIQERRRFEQDMIDVMGHELRTPMSIVKNILSYLEMELRQKGEITIEHQKKYVATSLDASRRESQLIETLLSATKADSKGFQLFLQEIDMFNVVDNTLLAFTNEAVKKNLQLIYNKPEGEFFAFCDATRVQEIIDNFVSNAIKYTQVGSVEIILEKDKDFVWLSVKDTGIGVTKENIEKLGKKFYRVDQYTDGKASQGLNIVRPGGTGLGLFVSFNLIKIMDGKLELKSKLGQGSVFKFGMPLYVGQKDQQVERKA